MTAPIFNPFAILGQRYTDFHKSPSLKAPSRHCHLVALHPATGLMQLVRSNPKITRQINAAEASHQLKQKQNMEIQHFITRYIFN
jgi:hypothetical protein